MNSAIADSLEVFKTFVILFHYFPFPTDKTQEKK